MPKSLMHRQKGVLAAAWLVFGLGGVALADPSPPNTCPLPKNSFRDGNRFKAAFASPWDPRSGENRDAPKYAEDTGLRELRKRSPGTGPVADCWKLAELQAHEGLSSDAWYSAASSPSGPPPPTNSCGWPAGRWKQTPYWLTDRDLDGERDGCADLRRSLLAECLALVIASPPACTVENGGANSLDGNLRTLLEQRCQAEGAAVPACSDFLAKLQSKTAQPIEPKETKEAKKKRLWVAGALFVAGAVPLVVGITHMVIPLGEGLYGSCPQHGLNYPCTPDRFGLGVPLVVTSGLFMAAGVTLLAVKF